MTSPSTTRQIRNARPECSGSRSPIHIRRSRITDLPQLRKMARLHGRELPEGRFLVAEIRSTIVAAAPVDKGDVAFGSHGPCSEQLQELLRRSYTGATPLPESGSERGSC
jgi:hypothetical protein